VRRGNAQEGACAGEDRRGPARAAREGAAREHAVPMWRPVRRQGARHIKDLERFPMTRRSEKGLKTGCKSARRTRHPDQLARRRTMGRGMKSIGLRVGDDHALRQDRQIAAIPSLCQAKQSRPCCHHCPLQISNPEASFIGTTPKDFTGIAYDPRRTAPGAGSGRRRGSGRPAAGGRRGVPAERRPAMTAGPACHPNAAPQATPAGRGLFHLTRI
jgi:hypothetical protein